MGIHPEPHWGDLKATGADDVLLLLINPGKVELSASNRKKLNDFILDRYRKPWQKSDYE